MPDPNLAADQLRQIVMRIETLEEQKREIAEDVKSVYMEGKANGFDVKTLRSIIKIRRMERNARLEQEELLALYKEALGID